MKTQKPRQFTGPILCLAAALCVVLALWLKDIAWVLWGIAVAALVAAFVPVTRKR